MAEHVRKRGRVLGGGRGDGLTDCPTGINRFPAVQILRPRRRWRALRGRQVLGVAHRFADLLEERLQRGQLVSVDTEV